MNIGNKQQKLRQLRNTEYSSICSLVAFGASFILIFTNRCKHRNILEPIIMLIMIVVCDLLISFVKHETYIRAQKDIQDEKGSQNVVRM